MTNDKDGASRPPNLLREAGFASKCFFAWAYPLMQLGCQRPLEEFDLPELDPLDTSSYNRIQLETLWEKTKASPKSNDLGRVLFAEYLRRTWWARILLAANMISRIGQALALGLLLDQFDSEKSVDPKQGYLWASVMVLCGLISFPSKQQQFFETYRIG
jgi:hypothetical protein